MPYCFRTLGPLFTCLFFVFLVCLQVRYHTCLLLKFSKDWTHLYVYFWRSTRARVWSIYCMLLLCDQSMKEFFERITLPHYVHTWFHLLDFKWVVDIRPCKTTHLHTFSHTKWISYSAYSTASCPKRKFTMKVLNVCIVISSTNGVNIFRFRIHSNWNFHRFAYASLNPNSIPTQHIEIHLKIFFSVVFFFSIQNKIGYQQSKSIFKR